MFSMVHEEPDLFQTRRQVLYQRSFSFYRAEMAKLAVLTGDTGLPKHPGHSRRPRIYLGNQILDAVQQPSKTGHDRAPGRVQNVTVRATDKLMGKTPVIRLQTLRHPLGKGGFHPVARHARCGPGG
jgi:hypothetical protein